MTPDAETAGRAPSAAPGVWDDSSKAKASADDYMMAVYRQENDGRSYRVVRNVYVPLVINGRRTAENSSSGPLVSGIIISRRA